MYEDFDANCNAADAVMHELHTNLDNMTVNFGLVWVLTSHEMTANASMQNRSGPNYPIQQCNGH